MPGRLGAGVGEPDHLGGRNQFRDPPSEGALVLGLESAQETEVQRAGDGLLDGGMAVPEERGSERGVEIDVRAAVRVDQPAALAALGHERAAESGIEARRRRDASRHGELGLVVELVRARLAGACVGRHVVPPPAPAAAPGTAFRTIFVIRDNMSRA